jgi:hypothetical protein
MTRSGAPRREFRPGEKPVGDPERVIPSVTFYHFARVVVVLDARDEPRQSKEVVEGA